jgi:predicted DCC family thiol-disulfide oxidoreductase YuxK
LTRAQVDRDAWAIDPNGRAYAGAAAINRALRELGPFWSAVGSAYQLPLIRWFEDRGYRWIANHRSWLAWLGDVPACEQPDARC